MSERPTDADADADADAAQALIAARESQRRSAQGIGPRSPLRYVITTALFAGFVGAAWDIPVDLWGVGAIIRFPMPGLAMIAWVIYHRSEWRARPVPAGYGRFTVPVVMAAALACHAAASVTGAALRDLGVPFPYTLAGMAFGAVFAGAVLAAVRRFSDRYRQRIAQGQW